MLAKDFFNPRSIAVIGASAHPEKIGFSVLKNIIDGGYEGRIYPINLDTSNILGLKCYPEVLKVPGRIELAVIVVPAEIVAQILISCGKKGIKYVIIISAGFAEAGTEGVKRQAEVEKIAGIYNMRILGPNCLGVIDPIHKLNISFANNLPQKKDIAVISQSGATCTAILDWANHQGVGFSHFVSLGNKVDLTENDFLEYFKKDRETKVVLGYLESFSDGQELLTAAKEITEEKPFILLKSGTTSRGQKAASSHTGALASDDLVVTTALSESGIIRAETVQDLFEWGQVFSELDLPRNNKVLVITNAGGPAVLATDAIASLKNLSFYDVKPSEAKTLKSKLPTGSSIGNPLDLLGDATSERFLLALNELKSPDLKLVLLTPQANTDIDNIAKILVEKKDNKTIVVLLGGNRFDSAWKLLSKNHIPVVAYPERAVRALDTLAGYAKYKRQPKVKETYIKGFKKAAEKVLRKDELSDADLAKILMAYNIPMASSKLTLSADEAIAAAENIGFPVVLKVTSPDILHKTESGAIKLGIENAKELRTSYQEVLKNAKKHYPKARILGVTVYKMVRSKVEVALGAKRDPIFGPVVMFGLGGIYIELLKDFTLGIGPISLEKAYQMIYDIKSYQLLDGFRNGERFDIEAIAKAISGLSELMIDFPNILEIDVNPLRVEVKGQGVLALDAKIILEKSKIPVS